MTIVLGDLIEGAVLGDVSSNKALLKSLAQSKGVGWASTTMSRAIGVGEEGDVAVGVSVVTGSFGGGIAGLDGIHLCCETGL